LTMKEGVAQVRSVRRCGRRRSGPKGKHRSDLEKLGSAAHRLPAAPHYPAGGRRYPAERGVARCVLSSLGECIDKAPVALLVLAELLHPGLEVCKPRIECGLLLHQKSDSLVDIDEYARPAHHSVISSWLSLSAFSQFGGYRSLILECRAVVFRPTFRP